MAKTGVAAAAAGAHGFETPRADSVAHHFALVDRVMRQATVHYAEN